jgi:hypothetical protein
MVASVSVNTGGWINYFLVDVRIIDSIFEVKSNSLATLGLDPSSIFGSFSLGILGEPLVVEFLGGILCKQTE